MLKKSGTGTHTHKHTHTHTHMHTLAYKLPDVHWLSKPGLKVPTYTKGMYV